jgi:cytochrome c-type biogenesis protein CcmF
MPTLGRACMLLALAIAIYGIVAAIYGARGGGRRQWLDSARRSVYAFALVAIVGFAVLEIGFLSSDFSYDVVASHSSTTTPDFYKATAIWSSQEGSLMLWVLLLSLGSSLALFLTRNRLREITPYATAVLLGFMAFFAAMLIFYVNPFAVTSPAPVEGQGLNPLLRHPSMMIHPPMLYSGYTLFAIPFAFAIGALITRRLGAEWVTATRRFALAAWFFLGIGILLGARWSYSELGWGGYWAWDAVENASLLPWLTGTAFLHSSIVQEKRGMLRTWNVSLVLATGTLALLGTFLVRSGIIESIHAFGASTLDLPFLVLVTAMIVASVYLVASRRGMLRSEHRLDSLLSREAVFLLNNVALVGLAFVIWWGTFFPLISEAVTGKKSSLGPPWFDRYTIPITLVLVLLTGIGPAIAWRRADPGGLRRAFLLPVIAALVTLGVLLVVPGVTDQPAALIMFTFGGFVLAVIAQEFWRGTRARRTMAKEAIPVALLSLVRRNRRRYGGYIVHVGVVVIFLGVAASSAFQDQSDVRMRPGQVTNVDGYEIRYVRPEADLSNERIMFGALLDVSKDGKHVATLRPERNYYPSSDPALGFASRFFDGERTSEVGLDAGVFRDVWTAMEPDLASFEPVIAEADVRFAQSSGEVKAVVIEALRQRYLRRTPAANFTLIVSPLVAFVWIGGIIMGLGGLIALWPTADMGRRRRRAGYAARIARETKRGKRAAPERERAPV